MCLKRHPKRLVLSSVCIILGAWTLLPPLFLDPSSDSYTDLGKCPACYGVLFCPEIHSGGVQLQQWSQFSLGGKYLNAHNVLFAESRGRQIVLKKLGSDEDLEQLDSEICELSNEIGCDPKRAIHRLAQSYSNGKSLSMAQIKSGSDFMQCPSQHKIDYVVEKVFAGNKGLNIAVVLDHIVTQLLLNPEPLLLQAFPASEGWPFPKYYGACGRIAVEEYAGPALVEYKDSRWAQRAHLAHQLLSIAKLLTDNESGFALYLTDVSVDNFSVAPDGTIRVIDLENMIVVDREGLGQGVHYNRFNGHTSDGYDYQYSVSDLCTHSSSDHNYYAVCLCILSNRYASSAMNEGLLHGIPSEIMESFPQLPALIEECVLPTREDGRFSAVEDLLKILPQVMEW